jgi:hypothetical protein
LESMAASSAVQTIKSALKAVSASSAAVILVEFKKALYAPLTRIVSASRSLGAALFLGSPKIGSISGGGATLVPRSSSNPLGNAKASGGKASGATSGGEQN